MGCAALICQCGVCRVNMPVWGVRRVYAGVLYSCNTVRVCDPCRSVTLYGVVSSTFVNQWKYRYVYLEFPSPFFQLPSLTIPVAKIYNFRTLIFTCLFFVLLLTLCVYFPSRVAAMCYAEDQAYVAHGRRLGIVRRATRAIQGI